MANNYELPTLENFGLEPVELIGDPGKFTVVHEAIGESDDELRTRAEADNRWDLYETHEIDVPTVSLPALSRRFNDVDRLAYSSTDDTIERPGRFIEAILHAQRELPTLEEFTAGLAKHGLVESSSAQYLELLDKYGNLHDDTDLWRERRIEPNEDDAFAAEDLGLRLRFFINTVGQALPADADVRTLSQKYAYHTRKQRDSDGHMIKSKSLLMQARGLNDDEISEVAHAMKKGRSLDESGLSRYRFYGLEPDLAEQVASAPTGSFLGRQPGVRDRMEEALTGPLGQQLAVRQFFGAQNAFDLLDSQHQAIDWVVRNEVNYSQRSIVGGLADSLLVNKAQIDHFVTGKDSLFNRLGPVSAGDRFKSLAFYALHEPSLRPLMEREVADEAKAYYRSYVDGRIADAKQSSL